MGEVDTGLIARDLSALTAPVEVLPRHAVAAAMAAADMANPPPMAGFHLWQPLRRAVPLMREGVPVDVQVTVTLAEKSMIGRS